MYHREYHRFYHRIFLIFGVGFLPGLLSVFFGQNILVNNTGFLDSDSIYLYRSLNPDPIRLFEYCIRVRGMSAVFLTGMTAAGLGGISVCLYLIWGGFCTGIILSVLSLRYGIRGIIFFVGAIMPQALCLIPAYMILIRWCVLATEYTTDKTGRTVFRVLRKLAYPMLLIAAGCLLEAYINPWIMEMVFGFL